MSHTDLYNFIDDDLSLDTAHDEICLKYAYLHSY